MIDIAMTFDQELREFDLALAPAVVSDDSKSDLLADDGLFTALIISLFTDARAADDDPLPESRPGVKSDRRGWWGDKLPDSASTFSMGSRLWLLNREKDLDEVVGRAELYAREAVQWLLDEGHVSRLEVEAERTARGWLAINISAQETGSLNERGREWNFFYDYQNAGLVSISQPGR